MHNNICDCPVVRHEHGSYITYNYHGCRCDDCSQDKREYQEAYQHLKKIGKITGSRVPAEPVRKRLQELVDDGISMAYLGPQIGIDKAHLDRIYNGVAYYSKTGKTTTNKRVNVHSDTYQKIMGYKPRPYMEREPSQRIPAAGSMRRLTALMCLGWTKSYLAKQLGVDSSRIDGIIRSRTVRVSTALAVRDVYEAHWDKRPQPETHYERGAITKTLRTAERHGWKPPMFWDDDHIDDPGYLFQGTPETDKNTLKREIFISDVETLLSGGETIHSIPDRLGISSEALERRLTRYGRLDLMKKMGWAA